MECGYCIRYSYYYWQKIRSNLQQQNEDEDVYYTNVYEIMIARYIYAIKCVPDEKLKNDPRKTEIHI